MANDVLLIGAFSQVGHKQMTTLVKMANVIIIKWGILLPIYHIIQPSYQPTYNLPAYLLQPTYL
jgi:hypothetical protein